MAKQRYQDVSPELLELVETRSYPNEEEADWENIDDDPEDDE